MPVPTTFMDSLTCCSTEFKDFKDEISSGEISGSRSDWATGANFAAVRAGPAKEVRRSAIPTPPGVESAATSASVNDEESSLSTEASFRGFGSTADVSLGGSAGSAGKVDAEVISVEAKGGVAEVFAGLIAGFMAAALFGAVVSIAVETVGVGVALVTSVFSTAAPGIGVASAVGVVSIPQMRSNRGRADEGK